MNKINPIDIVKEHIATLKNIGCNRLSVADLLLFFVFPVFMAMFFVNVIQLRIDSGAIEVLITVFSIFIALLFNLLLLIYDIVNKAELFERNKESIEGKINNAELHFKNKLRLVFIKQVYSNVSFCILISVILLIMLSLGFVLKEISADIFKYRDQVSGLFSGIIYSLFVVFVLTLLMVLKRVHALLSVEMSKSKEVKNAK